MLQLHLLINNYLINLQLFHNFFTYFIIIILF